MIAAALCLLAAPARGGINDVDAQSLRGPTGYAIAPSADTLAYREGSFALHRFQVGLAYGWPRNMEFGVNFDLREVTPVTPFTRDTYRARAPFVNLHAKYRLLSARRTGLDAALGVWRHTYYLALSPRPWRGFRIEAGPSVRRRSDESHQEGGFAALSLTGNWQTAFLEYDSQVRAGGAGWRYLIADNIRVDLLFTGVGRKQDFFDRLFFGLTITGIL